MKLFNILKKFLSFNPFLNEENIVEYLCSGEALPSALSEQEETEILLKMETEEEWAKQQLIEHNLRLVVYIAKKFESADADVEDLISIGSVGLIKAINSFKPDKNIKIATYASKCIENEILMYLRKISKYKREISIDEPLNVDSEGNELNLTDLISDDKYVPQDDLDNRVEKQLLWKILNKLNPREKEIMVMRYGLNGKDEMTQKEVASDLGISQSYISRLEKKILSRIRKEMLKAW